MNATIKELLKSITWHPLDMFGYVDMKYFQDTFLPHVESGTVTLVGATTENPSFHINSALLSRCQVIVLEKLSLDNLRVVVDRALQQLGIIKLDSASHAAKLT